MTEKVCRKCGEAKALDQFNADKNGRLGVRGRCRDCEVGRHEDYRLVNRDTLAAKKREDYKNNREAERKRHRDYYHANADRLNATHKEWRTNNQHIIKAQDAVTISVARGDIPRASELECVACGGQAKEYHHHSYKVEDRLNVKPVCKSCHAMLHTGSLALIGER